MTLSLIMEHTTYKAEKDVAAALKCVVKRRDMKDALMFLSETLAQIITTNQTFRQPKAVFISE